MRISMDMGIKHAVKADVDYQLVISTIRETLKLSQEKLARVLDVSVRTIVRWEREGEVPPPLEGERLDFILQVSGLAKGLMAPEDIPSWFTSPKSALSGSRPIDLLSTYRGIQQVQDLLEKIRWGII